MHPTTPPLAVSSIQFEDLSCELFLGFRRAAKMRMKAASQHYPLIIFSYEKDLYRRPPFIRQEAVCQPELTHGAGG